MASNVRVATLGPQPPAVDADTSAHQIVDLMISFWQRELAQVLPDRPDLILVPETCDCPLISSERKATFYRARSSRLLVIEENAEAGILYGSQAVCFECDFGRELP